MNKRILLRVSLLLLIAIWIFGFSFPVLFPNSNITIISTPIFHKFYSNVCHQLNYKSFHFGLNHLLICARCSGIYFGVLLSAFVYLFFYKNLQLKLKYFLVGITPMLVDAIFQSINISAYNKISAVLTGLIFGFTILTYFISTIDNSFSLHNQIIKAHETK